MPDRRIIDSDRAARLAFAGIVCALGLLFFSGMARAATWSIQTTTNAPGAEHSSLYDIECDPLGLTMCLAVGKKVVSGTSSPYAQTWNGTAWSGLEPLAPAEATASELQSVDCTAKAGCYAAGSYTNASGTFSLVESWFSESKAWSIRTTTDPVGASETRLKGISCWSLFFGCNAVGYSVKGGVKTAFAETGATSWTIQTVPMPPEGIESELNGVDCTSSTSCFAVGRYFGSKTTYWAMAAYWNGTSWSLQSVPNPASAESTVLLDLSCSSSTSCTAVGGFKKEGTQRTFVERWNGTSWSYQASPNPVGSNNSVFQNVSCTSGALCVAVGDWRNEKSIWQPMAQQWTGSVWALDTTPTPSGATESLLEGVSCRVETCLASGWYTKEGKNKTLGETR